ncbi:MAG: hypothetical protein C5B49_12945 [Bdellovibrio sp.]|nr:MAG: hypothetical protein C5B49_12945 [Bdellovibrio sp.]
MKDDFAILVLSCDKYAHIWPAFFACFRKYFPECRWPVYLGSNELACSEPGVVTLLSGEDIDWSTSFLRILRQVPERRLFIILEDLLLASPMNASLFEQVIDFQRAEEARLIKYFRATKPDKPHQNPLFGMYDRGAPYRAVVVGFWDKACLESLLIPGENPWNFEILGSYRTSYSDGFYCLNDKLCDFANMIEKGKWYPEALAWAHREGLNVGESFRPTLRGRTRLISGLQILYYKVMLKVPWRRRLWLMNWLRKLLISY